MDDTQGDTQRSCGSCSLCCKLLAIEGVEERPGFTWCRHCRPGKGGCSIYDHRPEACRSFVCGWLSGMLDGVLDPERWHPTKARMMLTAETVGGEVHVVVHVDPSFPERWRQAPYGEDIRRLVVAIPPSQRLFVRVAYRLIEIRQAGEFDHGEVPMAGWTDQRNARLAESFQRTGAAFVRKEAR